MTDGFPIHSQYGQCPWWHHQALVIEIKEGLNHGPHGTTLEILPSFRRLDPEGTLIRDKHTRILPLLGVIFELTADANQKKERDGC